MGWSYLEVHSPIWDEGKEYREDFHQGFHFLYFLLWEFASIGHFGTVEQRWFVASWKWKKKKKERKI